MSDKLNITQAIYHLTHKNDKVKAIDYIAQQYDYSEMTEFFKRTPKIFKGLCALPYLKRKSYADIYRKGWVIQHDSILGTIGLIAFVCERNKELLTNYLALRKKFEKEVLLSHYESAHKVLNEINNSISYSLWALTSEIKLYRLESDLNTSLDFYNKTCIKHNIVSYVGLCALKSSSIEYSFDNDVDYYYGLIYAVDDKNKDFKNFLLAHTFPYKDFIEGNWMVHDTNTSIIDLFLSLRDNLWSLPKDLYKNDDFRHKISAIKDCLNDDVITKFCYLIGIPNSNVCKSEKRDRIFDLYYSGNYKEVISQGKDFLQESPTDIDILNVVCRSMLLSGDNQAVPTKMSSILDTIIYDYCGVLNFNQSSKLCVNKLLIICKAFYNILGIRNLYTIVSNLNQPFLEKFYDKSWCYSEGFSISDIGFYKDIDCKLQYIEHWNPSNKEFYKNLLLGYDVPDNDLLRAILDDMDSYSFIQLLLQRWNSKTVPCYYQNAIASQIFNYYAENSRWKEAVLFYVNNKLSTPVLNITAEKNDILFSMAHEFVDDREYPLEMSIFYTMLDAPASKRYLAYKHYLKRIEKRRASEIEVTEDNKLKYFLYNVADQKVLGLHRREFSKQEEVIDERLKICNNLYDYFHDEKLSKEITSLMKGQKIKSLIKQVDESKIYVDEDGIKRNELEDEKAIFTAFQATDEGVEYNDPSLKVILDYLKRMSVLVLDEKEDIEKINYKDSLFRNFFVDIRNKFLLDSKYGLDFYLSTRIRHGTLVGQLRRSFADGRLITNMDESGNYQENLYWLDDVLKLKGEAREKCKEKFLWLTKFIDSRIMTIKDQYIQIKTESINKELNAVFDFSLSPIATIILHLSEKCSNLTFEESVDKTFSLLWKITEDRLEQLRCELDTEQTSMQNAVAQMLKSVVDIVGEGNPKVKTLENSVTSCSTGLQHDFATVKRWFVRKNINSFDFSLSDVLSTCTTIINDMNQGKFNVDIENNCTSLFKGDYFNNLYDIFHDILSNALNYQKKVNRDIECKIKINEDAHLLTIIVSNWIDDSDYNKILDKIKESEARANELITMGLVSREGHSGILKIKNLVTNVVQGIGNKYINKVEKNLFTAEIMLDKTNLVKNENTIN